MMMMVGDDGYDADGDRMHAGDDDEEESEEEPEEEESEEEESEEEESEEEEEDPWKLLEVPSLHN